MINVNLVRI